MREKIIKQMSLLGSIVRKAMHVVYPREKPFPGSQNYWVQRYTSGGNSGAGSYGCLAEFKSQIINRFVKENKIANVIEFGCGDGNQLKLAEYPSYIGYDVSSRALVLCKAIFRKDRTKIFRLMNEYQGETAQLTLSLDVIYHLIEDDIYDSYMQRLFDSSERFVIIYSSDFEKEQEYHERRRKFTSWITANKPDWKLIAKIPNRFPFKGEIEEGSLSDFYIYEKK
jgi:hypothetical protein